MEITRDTLVDLYENQLLTETQIAKRFGCSQSKIGKLRKAFGIPTIKNRSSLGLPPLTQQQKELLIGSLLGDGYLRVGRNRDGSRSDTGTAAYDETHSPKQYGYLNWKAEIMQPFTAKVIDCVKVSDGKEYLSRRLTTTTCTHFYPYYEMFYTKQGKRVFPANLKDVITPFVLAVWYLDDGNLNRYSPRITFGLDDRSLKRALKALRKLGLHPVVHEDKRDTTCTIMFPGEDQKFFDLIRPHVPDCMSYKLPVNSERKNQDLNAKNLTSEKAVELYEGGMSYAHIAKVFGVGVSTVRRRVAALGKPKKKMGRPRKEWSVRSAEVTLSQFDSQGWANLSTEDQDSGVEYVLSILRKVEFPTPPPEEKLLLSDLKRLQNLDTYLDGDVIRPRNYIGVKACSSFFPNRFKAQYRGKLSAHSAWYDQKHLKRAIQWQLRVGDPVTPQRVLKALTANCRTPTVFRPAVAKYLYETYCPQGGLVYDPCSGYGGRLLGAISAGVRYIGTDVEKETVEGNLRIREILGLSANDYKVLNKPAEEFDPCEVDMVFTSPPYFDVEHYSKSGNQSFKKYGKYEAWLEGFLLKVVQTSYNALPNKGILALNVADIKTRTGVYPLVEDAKITMKSVGFEEVATLRMPLASLNRNNQQGEPVLVFRKIGAPKHY